jgi:DNA-directed RNA polymerase specialized sigma24 family protein
MPTGIERMADEGRHPLAGTDWLDVQRRLLVYASSLYRAGKVMEGTGKSATDLVGDVIVQLLQRKIRFDGKRPLLPLLKKALYRDYLDLKKSAGRRTTRHPGGPGEKER